MAYARYKLAKIGSMTDDIWLYTEFPANWKYFFNETTMTPDAPGDVDKVLTIRQFSRRRGPNDPNPYTVQGHQRFFARTAKSKGSARPGNPYKIGEKAPLGPGYRELRQFSILGDDMNVLAYIKNKAKFEVVVWSPNGWSKVIPGATGQPAVAATSGNP